MLDDTDATAMLAVKDIGTATTFYEGTLGFAPSESEQDGMVMYTMGRTPVQVYESEYAGTNQANALAWGVGDRFDEVMAVTQRRRCDVRALRPARHDPGGDVHTADDFKAAWFKDPDGNILHINSG